MAMGRRLRLAVAGVLVLVLACAARADESPEPADPVQGKLIGVWESTNPPPGARLTVEFTRDGKLELAVKLGDRATTAEGTYQLDGKKLTVRVKQAGEEKASTVEITKLTDKELATKGPKGKVETFKRLE
jgi:uncharacterized protein (TIGR03066 family)